MVMALWLGLLPAASAGNKIVFVYWIVRDKFGKSRDSASHYKSSRMHLQYVLTKEMTPWIDKLPTYLSDPLHNEDPEPYIKRYIAGGTELEYQKLEQNHTKRQKHNTINT